MAIDTTRALLVSKPYRYVPRSAPEILAKFPSASEITIETNLDEAAAIAIADALFAAVSVTNAAAFSFTIEDVPLPEDFTTAPPRFTLAFDGHPATAGGTFTVTSAQPDYMQGTCSFTVRGS